METKNEKKSLWSAVWAMTLCAFVLIASEFMPVSLLTPIGQELEISNGYVGQTISISGFFAFFTSIFLTSFIGEIDRKKVLQFFTLLMAISGLLVTFAPNIYLLLLGRALLGVTIGGFWSMSASTILRLVKKDDVPKALNILNGGNALATMIAAPLGSYLGGIIGWRGAFFIIVPVALITLFWQSRSLPSLEVKKNKKSSVFDLFFLLKKKIVIFGMISVTFYFMGQFALFSYIRPYLEDAIRVDYQELSILLFAMGISGFFGVFLIGKLLKKSLYSLLIFSPFIMMIVALCFVFVEHNFINIFVLISIWGFIGTPLAAVWWTWLSKTLLEDEIEIGGGLMVAVIQLAITFGAFFGGVLFDNFGYESTFLFSALILFLTSVFTFITRKIYKKSI
ncbi:MFS transporter [Aliarcobacter cryaerophilus]|uniref:MFS transporter n=1 Tax=Aliarcobacter cryaerophilus TaxID=28198 RepID=UPI003DA1DE5C